MPKTHAETTPATSTPPTSTPTSTPTGTSTPPVPSQSDALSPALRELIGIFAKDLAAVSFPGVDHKTFMDLAEQVDTESQRVEELRAQLDTAHSALIEVKSRLQRSAEQGLAYAKVYAANDAELLARLNELNIGGETPRRRKLEVAAAAATDPGDGTTPIKIPAKRGRKPKAAAAAAEEETETETGS